MKCGMEQSGKHLKDAKRLQIRRFQKDCKKALAEGVSDFDWSGQFQPIPSYPHISGVWSAFLSGQFQLIPA